MGVHLDPKELAPYRQYMDTLVQQHRDHKGIQEAHVWLDRLLSHGASRAGDSSIHYHLSRLAGRGVTGKELLTHIGSVYLFRRAQPSRLPDDARLTFAIARAVLYARPLDRIRGGGNNVQYRKPFTGTLTALGTDLRETLSPLFYRLGQFLDAEGERQHQRKEAMFTPFTAAPAAFSVSDQP